ncbi:MAG: TIGR03663 family protein [Chloroflexi bacterium]|nr:TIGR03663 family protein [Chloroflexota bacterium]
MTQQQSTAPSATLPLEASESGAHERRGLGCWLTPRWEIVAYLVLIGVALVLRLWDLGARAMHHDESLHAYYSWLLFSGQGYEHNPLMHGPFQFHANALVFFLFGDSDYTARLLYVLFGTALVGLPWFLRGWLGRTGALATSLLLAFSPTMLYFSRFARNDILMAVWVLGMVVCFWRYMQEQKPRYLYVLSALLALAFATKETVYLAVVVFGAFFLLLSLGDLKKVLLRQQPLGAVGPTAVLFLLIFTLTLPQWSALSSFLQGPLGIVLASKEGSGNPVGLPARNAVFVAAAVVALSLVLSFVIGLKWNWRRWLVCAALFYSLWVLLYTSVFTNPFGMVTGMWQSLGYWMAQQGVSRGGQPWYYYFVIGWTYEFLPFLLALAAMGLGVWRSFRRVDPFGTFLIFWALANFLLFTWASEKMPWLLVPVTLPFVLLAGRFLGGLIEMVPWQRVWQRGAVLGVVLLPFSLVAFYRLLFYEPEKRSLSAFLALWGWILLALGLLALVLYFCSRVGKREGLVLLGLSVAAVFLVFTFRAGWRASYVNGDVPVEMLVYTQTTPELADVAREVTRLGEKGSPAGRTRIVVDSADGFNWPWAWYFRRYPNVAYADYAGVTQPQVLQNEVLIINARNFPPLAPSLAGAQGVGRRIYHRWWFPESYRLASPSAFFRGLKDRAVWRRALDYWLYRKLGSELGHVDAYLYYPSSLSGAFPSIP